MVKQLVDLIKTGTEIISGCEENRLSEGDIPLSVAIRFTFRLVICASTRGDAFKRAAHPDYVLSCPSIYLSSFC